MQKKNSFDILSVPMSASALEVKRSYKELVKRWHPDRFVGDIEKQKIAQERLKEINVAYREVLDALKVRSDAGSYLVSRGAATDPYVREGGGLSIFRKIGMFLKKKRRRISPRGGRVFQTSRSGKRGAAEFPNRDDFSGDHPDFQKALKEAVGQRTNRGAMGQRNGRCSRTPARRRYGRGGRRDEYFHGGATGRRGMSDRCEKIRPVGRVRKIGD